MTVSAVTSISLSGLVGHRVEVETDISNGLFRYVVIGLPDASLGEAKERVRSALENSGFEFPVTRTTVNLSPAELPKHGAGHDLAIAVSLLVAQGVIDPAAASETVFLGELALSGHLRPIQGTLPLVAKAAGLGAKRIIVPRQNLAEAELISGPQVIGASRLREVAVACGVEVLSDPDADGQSLGEPGGITAGVGEQHEDIEDDLELSDVVGQPEAVNALKLAAAGGHHLFLLGPPGAGKSLLASRLPPILPDLGLAESLEVTALRSLTELPGSTRLSRRPPWQAPHHTATAPAIVGGGSGMLRPGAASLASHGVLFLDEVLEFRRHVLDSLRQSMETGEIVIHRAKSIAVYPAKFQLVMAANPCPCGQDGVIGAHCVCDGATKRRYAARLSGPMLDRVDIQLRMTKVAASSFLGDSPSTTTQEARAEVTRAREVMVDRLADTPWRVNAQVPGSALRGRFRPARNLLAPLDSALDRGAITMRGYDRVLRVAWTVADVEGASSLGADHIGQALYLRQLGG